MKKFILKISAFVLPAVLMYFFCWFFYSTDKGDLLRVGYLIDYFPNYRSIFEKEFSKKILFTKVSEIDLKKRHKYKVLTVGDSFSEQHGYGYKNFLAENKNISVLHLDDFLSNNPIQTMYGLLNGDFLNQVKVDYIILQSCEKGIVQRAENPDVHEVINIDSLKLKIKNHEIKVARYKKKDEFSGNRILKFSLHNAFYCIDDNALRSEVFKVVTKEKMFSVDSNELLFAQGDLKNLKTNNNVKSVSKLNQVLNDLSGKLKKRDITLIVLPSPDKYDFYFETIKENKKYPKPLFFEKLDSFRKDYSYINSKKILASKLMNKKDVYFYDDTHWGPQAARVIAFELDSIISNSKFK